MPRNMVMAMTPMMARVWAAFRACGRRKPGTPLEMASTPVRAVDPDENACRTTNSPTVGATPLGGSSPRGGRTAPGHLLVAHVTMPVATNTEMDRVNAVVVTATRGA